MLVLPLVLALQKAVIPPAPPDVPHAPAGMIATTTPAGGDTVGYWGQRADYAIVTRLDEARHAAVASGETSATLS